jgi:predicted dehydrogenase
MRKNLAVGIVGTGLIAREHAQAISRLRDSVSLVGAADIIPDRLREFCRGFQVPREYQDAADLIADPTIDLVAITTPPAAHESVAIAALDHGKHVLCEKPLAHSLAGAVRIAEAAARNPGRLAVSYQMRYDPSVRRLLWLCQSGSIGEIQSALVERHSYIPRAAHASGWWGTWKVAGGGVLLTQLIHEIDLLVLAMGRPLAVRAAIDTRYTGIESEDFAEVTIRFSGGRTARCVASVGSGKVGGQFTIRGTLGTVGLPWNLTTKDPGDVAKVTEAIDRALPETRPLSHSVVSRGARFIARRLGVNTTAEVTPHTRLYGEIARNIQRGAPLPIPADEALGSLELCMAAYESALTGKEVALPLTSMNAVYGGIAREDYDARKCSRNTLEQATV